MEQKKRNQDILQTILIPRIIPFLCSDSERRETFQGTLLTGQEKQYLFP